MKWWFSDFDGTINKRNHNIDSRDIKFIRNWTKKNKLVIATGRILPHILPIYNSLNINYDYIICCNGSIVYRNKINKLEVISATNIDMLEREKLLKLIHEKSIKFKIWFAIRDHKYKYSLGSKEYNVDENPKLSDITDLSNDPITRDDYILNEPQLNIVYVIAKIEKLIDLKEYINKNFKTCKAIQTSANTIEIVNIKVSKALGIEKIREIEKFNLEDVITSGDGENDIEMLDYTNNSFVMKNSQPGVENHANYKIDYVFEIENHIKGE